MPKTILALLIASSLFVFSVKAQERDDARLKPAERNRTGTLRQLIPGYYVFSPPALTAELSSQATGLSCLTP
jgi:hypothetical protein